MFYPSYREIDKCSNALNPVGVIALFYLWSNAKMMNFESNSNSNLFKIK
jgi:hypothetical protein